MDLSNLPKDVQVQAADKTKAALAAPPAFVLVPPVPSRLPLMGDRVNFVLRKLGAGVASHGGKPQVKIRPATVTEDWQAEKHPVLAWNGVGKCPEVRGQDGKPFAVTTTDEVTQKTTTRNTVPPGTINLEIHLDGHGRRDLNAGHNKYEGDVLYDPVTKAPGTWHWPGE